MDKEQALLALSALSQETRLMAFKTLLEYGRTGVAAGIISERLGIPHNTLSFHLSHLSHAGLVKSRKEGVRVFYKANCDAMEGLLAYLQENCCIRETEVMLRNRRRTVRMRAVSSSQKRHRE